MNSKLPFLNNFRKKEQEYNFVNRFFDIAPNTGVSIEKIRSTTFR